jgi:predicted metalloprotease with PDZ domain
MKNIFQLKKYYYFLFNSSGYYKNGTIIWLIMNTFIKKKTLLQIIHN